MLKPIWWKKKEIYLSPPRVWNLSPKKPPKTDRLGLKFDTQTEGLGMLYCKFFLRSDKWNHWWWWWWWGWWWWWWWLLEPPDRLLWLLFLYVAIVFFLLSFLLTFHVLFFDVCKASWFLVPPFLVPDFGRGFRDSKLLGTEFSGPEIFEISKRVGSRNSWTNKNMGWTAKVGSMVDPDSFP